MHIDKYERYFMIAAAGALGLFFAALLASTFIFGVRLPDAGSFINPNRLDETAFAEPGIRDMGGGRYEAYILARMWVFETGSDEYMEMEEGYSTPVVRFPLGSVVTFNITSRDVTHGFIIERHNANIEVIPGHVGTATVTFDQPGTYFAMCHEFCGLNHHSMHFAIIVEDELGTVASSQ